MSVKAAGEVETARFGRAAWLAWGAVVVALIAGGISYRLVTEKIVRLSTKRIILPVPLGRIPKEIGDWTGTDEPLSPEVERIAGNDDYINRLYVRSISGEAANLYIAYSGRPRTMVGHRPQVCYVNAGWLLDWTQRTELALEGGGRLPCLLHRFELPPPKTGEVYVLNYYILNGVTTNDEDSFAGVSWRLPNINGNPAWYVTQVQMSSRSEAALRDLAGATVGTILEFLPDREGKVAAEGKYRAENPDRIE